MTKINTAAVNDLVLTTTNEGSVYEDLKNIVFAALQGATHRGMKMRDIVSRIAQKSRKEFGSKYSAADVTAAAVEVEKDTIEHCLEIIAGEYDKSRDIVATCRRWFDKINGNSYFSVNIQIPRESGGYRQINIPFQYGYGDHWKWETAGMLERIGVFDKTSQDPYSLPVMWIDQGHGIKRDMFKGVSL